MNKLIAPAAAALLIATAMPADATPVTWTFITTNCTALFGGSCNVGEPTPSGMYVPPTLSLTLPGPTDSGSRHRGQPGLPDFSSGNASSGAASYNTYRNSSEVGSATSTSYTDSGLSAKTSHTCAVIAVNPAGESAQSSAETPTSPDTRSGAITAPPTGLTVSSTTTSSVTLTWNASTGATSYDVYRSGTKVGSSASTSYTDNGLSPGTTYIYAVTAVSTTHLYTATVVNSSGESGITGRQGGNAARGGDRALDTALRRGSHHGAAVPPTRSGIRALYTIYALPVRLDLDELVDLRITALRPNTRLRTGRIGWSARSAGAAKSIWPPRRADN